MLPRLARRGLAGRHSCFAAAGHRGAAEACGAVAPFAGGRTPTRARQSTLSFANMRVEGITEEVAERAEEVRQAVRDAREQAERERPPPSLPSGWPERVLAIAEAHHPLRNPRALRAVRDREGRLAPAVAPGVAPANRMRTHLQEGEAVQAAAAFDTACRSGRVHLVDNASLIELLLALRDVPWLATRQRVVSMALHELAARRRAPVPPLALEAAMDALSGSFEEAMACLALHIEGGGEMSGTWAGHAASALLSDDPPRVDDAEDVMKAYLSKASTTPRRTGPHDDALPPLSAFTDLIVAAGRLSYPRAREWHTAAMRVLPRTESPPPAFALDAALAEAFASHGMVRAVTDILGAYPPHARDRHLRSVRMSLAVARVLANDPDGARAAYAPWLEDPTCTPDVVRVAEALAARGERDEALRVVRKHWAAVRPTPLARSAGALFACAGMLAYPDRRAAEGLLAEMDAYGVSPTSPGADEARGWWAKCLYRGETRLAAECRGQAALPPDEVVAALLHALLLGEGGMHDLPRFWRDVAEPQLDDPRVLGEGTLGRAVCNPVWGRVARRLRTRAWADQVLDESTRRGREWAGVMARTERNVLKRP